MSYPYYEVIWDMKVNSFSTLEDAMSYAKTMTYNNAEKNQALIIAKKDVVTISSIFVYEQCPDGFFVMSNLVI